MSFLLVINMVYKTKKWIKKREVILRRDNYQCKECSRYGRTTQANTVHHIFPLETYPEFGFTSDNLVSLCSKCHNEMHDRITNEITFKGLQWQDKVRAKLNL